METGHSDAHFVALANCPVFGPKTLEILSKHFETWEEAWNANGTKLQSLGIPDKRIALFEMYRSGTSPKNVVELCEREGISVLTKDHPHYPELLKTIFDPPFVLFAQGDTSLLLKTSVAMVGSRNATNYGREVAQMLSKELSRAGVIIVSGLAHGIDSIAHEGTLEGGKTIAVLGNGLLFRMAQSQENLKSKILERGGLVLSEYPLKTPGYPGNFPVRNRIVAGMATAAVIIEAGLPSGSLITAKASLENGRDVFAVPGPITSPLSAGTNDLLRDGAHVATCAHDILSLLGLASKKKIDTPKVSTYTPENDLEKVILNLLIGKEVHIDEIIMSAEESPSKVSQTLVALEIKAVIKNVGGMRYVISR